MIINTICAIILLTAKRPNQGVYSDNTMSVGVGTPTNSSLPPVNRSWFGQRAKRTEAMPDGSMVGSSLQIRGEKFLDDFNKLDIEAYDRQVKKERLARQQRYVLKLPDSLKKPENG